MSESRIYEGWASVFETSTDYEAEIVRDRLGDAGLKAVVLSQRDHAFNLTSGKLAIVRVMVAPTQADEALAILDAQPISDEDLAAAAEAAGPAPE